MKLLVVGRREFWSLLNAAPSLGLKIMSTLSRRVREAEATVSA
jgi:CRP-like cAMP-binding protein